MTPLRYAQMIQIDAGPVYLSGPSFVLQEDEIWLDGAVYKPQTVIEAARLWLEEAENLGWELKDLNGKVIDRQWLIRQFSGGY